MGVELAYVAGLTGNKGIRLATAASILVSGVLFMFVLAPRKMKFPQEDDLRDAIVGIRKLNFTVIEQLLGVLHAKNSMVYQYWYEGKRRGDWFKLGLYLFALTQILLALLIGWSK